MRSPLWSVMLPVYEPTSYIKEALRSVLDQDPGPAHMQIAVVDDSSPCGGVEELVRAFAGNRISYIRQPCNLGLARNWNDCITRAHGELIHLLHHDDLVYPGFYDTIGRGFVADDGIGMAFSRHRIIDADSHEIGLSGVERPTSGAIDGWLERIAAGQRLQCPAAVVRRDVYDAIGGFRQDLCYVLDWEMWVRIAARYRVWFEPRVLAAYRMHSGSETARLRKANLIDDDQRRALRIIRRELPRPIAYRALKTARRELAHQLISEAVNLSSSRQPRAAISCIIRALRFSFHLRIIHRILSLAKRTMFGHK